MSDILSIQRLTKRFSAAAPPVVDEVSFTVGNGEIVALLGPSGCGKTTTLRLVAGFEHADAGTVTVGGRMLTGPSVHVPPEARGVGVVFQDYALFPHLSVLENVVFGLQRLPRSQRVTRAREILKLVGLSGYEQRRPHQLSGGQQQRVAIARTLAPMPKLVLLDEPFSNLDALLRQATRQEIRAVLKEAGLSALLVTHDQEEALSFADRVGVMRAGRIEQVGTPEEVYYRPRTLFVAQFLGRTNLLFSQATGDTAETPLGPIGLNRPAAGDVLLAVRPEHLTLEAPETAGGRRGRIIGREFKGHDITFRVEMNGAEYLVHTDNLVPFQPGDFVSVRALAPAVVLENRTSEIVASSGATPPLPAQSVEQGC